MSSSSSNKFSIGSVPIPSYAKKWGRNVKRLLKAPTDLDVGHIALQDIFLRETADGSEEFVVLEACNRCRALELKCDHALCCSDCKNFGTSCVRRGLFCKPLQSILSTQANLSSRVFDGSVPSPNVANGKGKRTGEARSTGHSDMSYVPLPHGYAKSRAKASKESTACTSVDDEPIEARTPNADTVSTNKRRQPDDEKMEKDLAVVSSTTTSALKPIANQRKEDTVTPNKRRKLDTEGTSGSKSKVSSRPAKTSATQPPVLHKGETTPKVKWTVPQHPPFTGQLPKNADRRKQPMVWAGSLEEFTAVLPEFARLTNNVSLYSSFSPTVVLDEKSWPDDRWVGNVITINFVRHFSFPVSSDSRTEKITDGLVLSDEIEGRAIEADPPLKLTPGGIVPPFNTKLDHPIKSDTPNLGSLKDKQFPTSMNNVVVSSSKGKGLSEVTPKFSSSHHTGHVPVANETPKPKQSHTLSNPAEDMSNPPIAPSHNEASGSLSPNICLCSDYRYDSSCNSCHPQSPSKSQDVCSGLEAPAASIVPFSGGIPKVENPSAKLQIPEPYPEEIVALQQSLDNGIPMKIVASSTCPLLPIAFDSKIKFGFLGFFHVIDAHVQVDFVKMVQHRGKPQKRGRVTWRFMFEWTPGGVPPFFLNLSGFNGDFPWWHVAQTEIHPAPVPFTQRPDRFYPDDLGYCLVPEYVLGDYGIGWLHLCGRLNVRGWRGSRSCDNCKVGCDVPCLTPIKEASDVRGPWRFSVVRPESKCPNGLTENITGWNTATVLHVFNCNLPALEKEADIIFKMFQGVFMEVVLDRPRTRGIAPTPRYRCTVGIPKSPRQSGQDSAAIDGPLKVQAGAASDAITIFPATRDMMLSLAKTYIGGIPGHELPGLEINWIEAMGWHEEIKTKVPGIADAVNAPVLFLCLGADIELIFDWKLGKRVKASAPPAKSRCATADKTTKANGTPKSGPQPHPIANSPVDVDEDTTLLSGAADDGDANSDVDAEDGAGGDEDSGTIPKTKSSVAKDTLRIMMTHGDLVMVTGGDLHYAILPRGYCMLLKAIG